MRSFLFKKYMPKSKLQKQEEYQALDEAFDKAKSVVLMEFANVDIHATEDLRRKMRQEGNSAMVAKKTLIQKLFTDKGVEGVSLDTVFI